MKISPQTKISALIKENPKAIDAIASINSHFEKLRNPILRKILASRVTIADAARIGNATVATFFEKLEPLGFQSENDNVLAAKSPASVQSQTKAKPSDMPTDFVELDVREAIETGNDPFNLIMEAVKDLQPSQALKLINTFEPTPLITILNKRGYRHFVEEISANLVYTYFYKKVANKTVANAAEKVETLAQPDAKNTFGEMKQKFAGRLREIDVRYLEMPLPMTTILETLADLKPGEALFVIHKRVPQFLLPQLAERGFAYTFREISPERVDLILYPENHGSVN
ncbi:DUF2249 domain-containing protein [Adhaeribacter sp. BT258]|uniref:DUF2249 domain-containing protein n=1 Tax=Adhaeribacter terrigena TaxID=2793070 RepID=A0ABS1BZ54_9BACT|nr:DUF2249 domain-containing protein [Adhaeribacter terrigena]MBK0402390.1 DUF2249 domain-containing protein [Adhaeribacter terrigena]